MNRLIARNLNWLCEIKTIDTIEQQLPTLSLIALLYCLVLGHLDYVARFLEQIKATSMISSEKAVELGFETQVFQIKN